MITWFGVFSLDLEMKFFQSNVILNIPALWQYDIPYVWYFRLLKMCESCTTEVNNLRKAIEVAALWWQFTRGLSWRVTKWAIVKNWTSDHRTVIKHGHTKFRPRRPENLSMYDTNSGATTTRCRDSACRLSTIPQLKPISPTYNYNFLRDSISTILALGLIMCSNANYQLSVSLP